MERVLLCQTAKHTTHQQIDRINGSETAKIQMIGTKKSKPINQQ